MEFAYSPRLAELKGRARTLTEKIMPFEDECERNNGISAESHASIKAAVLDSGLQAINTPTEFGGAGLTVLEQVVVQDELGKLTNALWDTVWRPANPLAHATPEQRERYLIPGARGDRRDAVAISEAGAGSDFSAATTTRRPTATAVTSSTARSGSSPWAMSPTTSSCSRMSNRSTPRPCSSSTSTHPA